MTDDSQSVSPGSPVNDVLSRVSGVAALPAVTLRIMEIVEDPNSTHHDLHEVVKNDPALASKVLKVVNSSFYGLPGQVSDMDRAIILLGLSAVQNIAIASSFTRMFRGDRITERYSASDLWLHSVGVGVAARSLSILIGEEESAEENFVAGLVHDLGLLLELQALPRKFAEALNRASSGEDTFLECERQVLGMDHEVCGRALAAKWKFPARLQACIGYHHDYKHAPQELQHKVALVQVADIICCRERVGLGLTAEQTELPDILLAKANVTEEHIANMLPSFADDCEAVQAMLLG